MRNGRKLSTFSSGVTVQHWTGDSQVCGANSVISSAEVRSVQNTVQNAASSCDMQRTRACDKLYPHQAVSAWPATTCRDMQMWKYSSKPEFYCSEQVTFAPHQHQCQPSSWAHNTPVPRPCPGRETNYVPSISLILVLHCDN